MVSMPFDINLEENAHGTFAVAVSDASASNEVGRVIDFFFLKKVKTKGKGTKMYG